MFVQLRQYLERVRNLCYMVGRREKMSRSYIKVREQVLVKQAAILGADEKLSGDELQAVLMANKGPTVYDQLHTCPSAPVTSLQIEGLLKILSSHGSSSATSKYSKNNKKKKDINGLVKRKKEEVVDEYKENYLNGADRRRSRSASSSHSTSTSDSDSISSTQWNTPHPSKLPAAFTTSEEDIPPPPTSNKKITNKKTATKPAKKSNRGRKPKKVNLNKSTDDEKAFDALLQNKVCLLYTSDAADE